MNGHLVQEWVKKDKTIIKIRKNNKMETFLDHHI